jgi:hypothetical protein
LLWLLLSDTSSPALERLQISGKEITHNGTNVFLQGANTLADAGKISSVDAENFKAMGMNFVRLLVDIDTEVDLYDSEGDGDYIYQSALDEWSLVTSWFAERQIWVLVELRSNDYDVSDSDFWVPGSVLHTKWKKIWESLALTLKDYDYIAAWGILAEHAQFDRATIKAAFEPVMQAIDTITGTNTPFCFGPKLNSVDIYNLADYSDWYWPEYANRIIYQVNHLHPKPYIANRPDLGYDPATWWYHRTDGQDGEGADNDGSMSKAGNLAHLQPAFEWRDFYNAPIYIDQWGCALNQPGYLDYERDLIEIFRENGNVPHTRWTYYQLNERGIMTDYYGAKELHPPLRDFWTMALAEDFVWPHVVSFTEYNLQDNHLTTSASGDHLPWLIDFGFSAPFACNKIELWNGRTSAGEDPATIEIYGSNDGSSWLYLATIGGIVFNGRSAQYFSPSFSNETAFLHYRAAVTGNGGGTRTTLSNLEFFPGRRGQGIESTPLVVAVQADTFGYRAYPDDNFGQDNPLNLRSRESNFSRVAFLKFSVDDIPESVPPAKLQLFSQDLAGPVHAYAIADTNWTETTLTWNNMPPAGALIGSGSAVSNEWFEIDITGYITGPGEYSIALEESGNVRGRIHSREGANAPRLVLTSTSARASDVWAARNNLAGADARPDSDPDLDGLDNLEEYATGSRPAVADPPDAALRMGFRSIYNDGAAQAELSFSRRLYDPDLVYRILQTDNLVSGTWETAPASVWGTAGSGQGFETVTNRVPVSADQLFLRLRLDLQE